MTDYSGGLNLYRGSTANLFEKIAQLKAQLATQTELLAAITAERDALLARLAKGSPTTYYARSLHRSGISYFQVTGGSLQYTEVMGWQITAADGHLVAVSKDADFSRWVQKISAAREAGRERASDG